MDMKRRDFLKTGALAGAALTLNFEGLRAALASNTMAVEAVPDMVAVMGGEPEVMLDKALEALGGIGQYIKKGQKVVIKPNIGWDRTPEMAGNTNPKLVKALVQKCLAAGAQKVTVFDHTCDNWQKCYETSGIAAAVKEAGGIIMPANDEKYFKEVAIPNGVKLKSAKIHEALVEADVWINVPVLKNHGGAKMTCAMKNYMGIVWDRRYFHQNDLQQCIAGQNPNEPWYRLILLEAMLFEPYYPLGMEKDKKGNDVPCKKYKNLNNPINGFKKSEGDRFLNEQFTGKYCEQGYVKRLRKSYDKRMNELNEVLKTVITSLSITAVISIVTVATAGAFAGPIAVALVGSNFAGLSGAALTSACLAYLGGGAIAAGGAGMLGGTIAIVDGGAALGIGVGAGVGGAVGSAGLMGKKNTIMQSAKLLTSVREIFLNDEHDIEFSNSVYEQYLQNITEIEKGLVELRLKKDVAKGKEKKAIAETIKKAEESVEAMKVARKSMLKYNSSFSEGLQVK